MSNSYATPFLQDRTGSNLLSMYPQVDVLDILFKSLDCSASVRSAPVVQEFCSVKCKQKSFLNENIEKAPYILNKFFDLYKLDNSYSYVFNRIKELLNSDNLEEDEIVVDEESFDSLYNFIRDGYINNIDFSIGLTSSGAVILQKIWNEKKYIYIQFLKDDKLSYNIVFKKWDILNLTGSFDEYLDDFFKEKEW